MIKSKTRTALTVLFLSCALNARNVAVADVINSGHTLSVNTDLTNLLNGFLLPGSVTLNGGTLLTNNALNLPLGIPFLTLRPILINTTGGTLCAVPGTTATYGAPIANGNGTTGLLTIGTAANTGTVVFSAANTYSGGTSVVGGTLRLSGLGTLGNAANALNLSGHGVLDLNGTDQSCGPLALTSGTISNTGAVLSHLNATSVTVNGASNVVSAGVNLIGAITQNAGSALTVNGTAGSDSLAASASLNGTGTVGAATLAGNNVLSSLSTLTLGGLAVNGTGNFISSGIIQGNATLNGSSALAVNGRLQGTITVGSGTLGGSGIVDGLATVNGGAITGTGLHLGSGAIFNGGGNVLNGAVTGDVQLSALATLAQTGNLNGTCTQLAGSTLTANGTLGGDVLQATAQVSGTGNLGAVVLNGGNLLSSSATLQTSGIAVNGTGNVISSGNVTGNVTINADADLRVDGVASGQITVGVGASLGGTGTTGSVTVGSGGNLNLQDGGIGTLNVGSLALGAGGNPAHLVLDIQTQGGLTQVDKITAAGTLNLNGLGGTKISIGTLAGTTSLNVGLYTLISATSIVGSLADLSLSTTVLDNKTLTLTLNGGNLDLQIGALSGAASYTLSASAANARIMTNGSTAITSTLANVGTTDAIGYVGLNVTTTGGITSGGGLPSSGGPVAAGSSASGSTTLTAGSTTGVITIAPTVAATVDVTSPGTATLAGTTSATVDVVANRVVTASAVDFGRVLVGQAVNATSTLSTSGNDANFTRVRVGTTGPDVNGIAATGGGNVVYNSASTTDTRSVTGTFTSAGTVSGGLNLTTTGEGLTGEAPVNVAVNYTADPVNKRSIINGILNDLGTLHAGALVNLTTSAFTSSGLSNTTTSVTVAAGNGVADANGLALTGAATTFDGSTALASDTRTLTGTISGHGTVANTLNLAVSTLENGGVGLAGEGNYAPVAISYTANVYTGQGVYIGTGSGSWGTINAHPNFSVLGGAPGLDSHFVSSDTALFGNSIGNSAATVTFNGVSPSLRGITFNNTLGGSYDLASGTGGTLKLNAGPGGIATVQNLAGDNSISAPIQLDSDAATAVTAGRTLTLGGAISDGSASHALLCSGPGTTVLSGGNTFSGGTTISSGTVKIANLAAFGSGNVNFNGGTLELGNGIKQINVNGDYHQTGGTLVLNLTGLGAGANPGYEFLRVAGTATLGGGLLVNVSSPYVPVTGDTFTFVQAGAIAGGFTKLQTNLAALFITQQGAGIIIGQLPYARLARIDYTPNERAVARYIDRVYKSGATSKDFRKIMGNLNSMTASGLPQNLLPSAMSQLSPERFFNFITETQFNNTVFQNEQIYSYLDNRRNLQGEFLPNQTTIDSTGLAAQDPSIDPALQSIHRDLLASVPSPLTSRTLSDSDGENLSSDTKDLKPVVIEEDKRSHFFIQGDVILAQGLSQVDVPHSHSSTASFRAGGDREINRHLLIGGFFDYSHADATLDHEGSTARVESYSPGIYASYATGPWYLNGIAAYSHDEYTEHRQVSFLGSEARARTSGDEGRVSLKGGYDFHAQHWTFGPTLGAQFINLRVNDFSESGSAAALHVAGATSDSFRTLPGGHLKYEAQAMGLTFRPHASASWQHEFLDQSRGITASLENLGEDQFVVRTPRAGGDAALVQLGLNLDVNDSVTVTTDYSAQLGQSNYLGQSVEAGVRIGF